MAPSEESADSVREDRRRQILRAAVKVFAEQGYHGARISDVAEEAGVAYGLVYHYFGNKENLLRSIFDANWAVFARAIEEIAGQKAPAAEKIRQISSFLVGALEAWPLVVQVLVLEFGRSSRLGDALDQPEVDRVFRAVIAVFEAAKASGELRQGIEPRAMSVIYMGALESCLASFVVPSKGSALSASDALEAMRRSLLHVFDGVFQEPVRKGRN